MPALALTTMKADPTAATRALLALCAGAMGVGPDAGLAPSSR